MKLATTIAALLVAGLPATAAMAGEPLVPTLGDMGATTVAYDDDDWPPFLDEYPTWEFVWCTGLNGGGC